MKQALTIEFFVQEILEMNILAQDYHSDDDVFGD
jgi:hypothetical protein